MPPIRFRYLSTALIAVLVVLAVSQMLAGNAVAAVTPNCATMKCGPNSECVVVNLIATCAAKGSTNCGNAVVCAPNDVCLFHMNQEGRPVYTCGPKGSFQCGYSTCQASSVCLSRSTPQGTEHFCAAAGSHVCGSGICGANYDCVTKREPNGSTGYQCVPKGSTGCGPYLRCMAGEQCFTKPPVGKGSPNTYQCGPPGSSLCGPYFICQPGTRCVASPSGKETSYRCLLPSEH